MEKRIWLDVEGVVNQPIILEKRSAAAVDMVNLQGWEVIIGTKSEFF